MENKNNFDKLKTIKDKDNQSVDELQNTHQQSKKKSERIQNQNSKLVQAFLGITLLILATYFILNFLNETDLKKKQGHLISKNRNLISQLAGGTAEENKLTEIQEKLAEKISQQAQLIEIFNSITKIEFKTEIKNKIIIEKIKKEFLENIFLNPEGNFILEVDIFNDLESTNSNTATTNENGMENEYTDTETNIILQMSFFNKKSKNKVSELGLSIPIRYFLSTQ